MNTKQGKGQEWLTEEQEIEIYGAKLKDGFRGDARSHIIYHDKQYENRRLKFTCDTKSPVVAYRTAPAIVRKKLNRPEDTPKVRPLITDEIKKFKERKLEEVGPRTNTVIRQAMERVDEYWGQEFCEVFDAEDFQDRWAAFREWHKGAYPGQTMFNVIKYARNFSKFLHEKGLTRKLPRLPNPDAKIEKLRLKKKKLKIYSREEFVRLCRACDRRGRLLCRMGYRLAFRISDCVTLKKSMVNLDPADPTIQFEGDDKADTFVKVPLTPDVVRGLRWQMAQCPESEWVFPQERDPSKHIKTQQFDFKMARKRAGVAHGTFHTLRHTRLTLDFGNAKIPQVMVMALRRVSLLTALAHYIHPTEADRKIMREVSL